MLGIKASTSVPLFSRFVLTVFEPLTTFYGVYLAYTNPEDLMANHFSRNTIHYAPETQVLYSQLAGMWALLALLEAFVLRSFDDLRLWKRFCYCLLVCDALYYHAVAGAVGGWRVFWDLAQWTGWDYFVNSAVLMLTSARVLVVISSGGKTAVKGKGE
jgi:hypothetical protein